MGSIPNGDIVATMIVVLVVFLIVDYARWRRDQRRARVEREVQRNLRKAGARWGS